MRLTAVRVTNFRCVEDSGSFTVGDVTCLVGKNESGKTSLLQALERLNPYDPTLREYDKTRDYPRRHLPKYDERHPDGKAEVVHSEWRLEADDVRALEAEFGKGCTSKDIVTVTKGFGDEKQFWTVPLDQAKVVQHLLVSSGCSEDEKKGFAKLKSVDELREAIEKTVAEERSDAINKVLARISTFRDKSANKGAIDKLSLPKFVYFGSYDKMQGNVSLQQLQQHVQQKNLSKAESIFLDFLAFAGIGLDELAAATKFEELKAKVEAASINISDQIFGYWSQNRYLRVNFELGQALAGDPPPFNTGNIMRTRVWNELHKMTVNFDDRSAGFVWFFSFLVYFSQVEARKGPVIILLDEPGLSLHAKAQEDLLRYVDEQLKPKHQVIYTTHSPFMVPVDNLMAARTVEDVIEEVKGDPYHPKVLGTKVGDEVLSTDKDTTFPLQGALGYSISQSLFVGEHTLLVEGPSDLLYLTAFTSELRSRGRIGLDKRWTICPAEGLDKINAFLSLFAGNKLHVAVFVDYGTGKKNKVEGIRASKLLNDGHVFTANEFCNKPEADTEDLLGSDLYAQMVNAAFGVPKANQLTGTAIDGLASNSPRIVSRVKEIFRTMPAGVQEFDHYEPARWLILNPGFLQRNTPEINETLDRFADLFKRLNALLA